MRIIDAVRGLLKEVGLLGKEGFVPSPTVQENPVIDPVDKDISTPRSTATPRSTVQEIRKSHVAKERVATSPLMCSVGTDEYYDQDVGLFELRPRDVTPLESGKEKSTAQEALVTEKEPSPKEKEASSKEKEPSPKELLENVPEEDAEENDSDDDAGSGDENTEEEGNADGDEGETTDEDSEKDDADGDDTDGEEGEGTDDDDTAAESSDKESAAKTNEDTDMSAPLLNMKSINLHQQLTPLINNS
ncbi:PREDICTED: secreted acidic protein 1A-like [Tarenaya hassleriana]|uniref:secreted acidic protein 1A-like n=1 Tax=Tarenaya hassleriana TaxID=28532 RepID=UPI00053C92AA|nr:PREDICTED: secreted acidic protein 1A-like [Tarenaya hassleriana]